MTEPDGCQHPRIEPDEHTWTWLRDLAARDYRGDIGAAATAILNAARQADQTRHHRNLDPADLPDDPWADLTGGGRA